MFDSSDPDDVAWQSRPLLTGTTRPSRAYRPKRRHGRPILTGPMVFASRAGGQVPIPDGQKEREDAHALRVARDDPGHEPVHCWGPCGRTLSNAAKARKWGWKVRDIRAGGATHREVQCPECWARWGFIEPPEEAT